MPPTIYNPEPYIFDFAPISRFFVQFYFLDTQVSLAPTHVSGLVSWLVGHTFGFPISGQ